MDILQDWACILNCGSFFGFRPFEWARLVCVVLSGLRAEVKRGRRMHETLPPPQVASPLAHCRTRWVNYCAHLYNFSTPCHPLIVPGAS